MVKALKETTVPGADPGGDSGQNPPSTPHLLIDVYPSNTIFFVSLRDTFY